VKSIPFYSNTPDGTHCMQASLRMVLKYFLPERDYSWEELETMTAKLPGKATWPTQMLLNLQKQGFAVKMIEGFDGPAFVRDGGEYLRRTFGDEAADWQITHSDIAQEQQLYTELLAVGGVIEQRVPTFDDLHELLAQGYLVICTLNSRKLNGLPGYVGHAVVVCGADDQNVTLNDPGPAAQEARQVSRQNFLAAWDDPNENAKSAIAIQYTEKHDE
jgi:hypothetical protein